MYLDTEKFTPMKQDVRQMSIKPNNNMDDYSDYEEEHNKCRLCSLDDKLIVIERNDLLLLGGMVIFYMMMSNK